jgi:hypothetical protein
MRADRGIRAVEADAMHRFVRLVLAIVLLTAASRASALTVSTAKIANGAVHVKGSSAAPLAVITWQGAPVAVASKGGSFHFDTSVLPQDCVGTVGDGAATVPAVVQYCGPEGPPGPPGAPGSAGAAAPASTVIDTFVYVGTFANHGNPTDLASLNGVRFQATCFPAVGDEPIQPSIFLYNTVNGGLLTESLVVTSTNAVIDTADGFAPSGGGFDAAPYEQVLGIHGVVSPEGGTNPVRVDVSALVTTEPIFHAAACRVFGVLTPTS